MIGNDVVDLQVAARESNWRRSGWVDKIFTKEEQLAIPQTNDADFTVWKMWSCKESVYKIINRLTGIRSFNPLSFACDPSSGLVNYEGIDYFTETYRSGDCIHTIAKNDHSGTHIILPNRCGITKRDNLPFYLDSGSIYPASISHHGRYCFVVAAT